MTLPLSHIKVLDLTRVRSGPTCVRQLADWGADCIKVEAPDEIDTGKGMGGARHGPDFQHVHRNKRGITLNLKHPGGLAAFHRMVRQADVVVENYRPDVKERLGIGYEALAALRTAGSNRSPAAAAVTETRILMISMAPTTGRREKTRS